MSSIRERLSSVTTTDKLNFLRERYTPIPLDIGPVKRLDNYNEFGRYYKTPVGNFPSVTTALGAVTDKSFLDRWRKRVGEEEANRISTNARNYGNLIHGAIENSALGRPFNLPTHYFAVPELIHKTLYDHISDISLIETFLYSKAIKIAGTVDCLAKWNGEWAIIDWKTSRNEKKREYIQGYFEQGFLYACMVKECLGIEVKKLVIPIFYLDQSDSEVFVERIQDVAPQAFITYQRIKEVMKL